MREIKFRAWDKKNKKMCKVLTIAFAELSGMNIEIQGLVGYYFLDNPRHTETYFELMQYTGLKVDNKEIYEGDICRNGDWEEDAHAYNYRIEEVVWDYDNAGWMGWNYNEDGMTCEIIGNVYENPKLLEEE